MQADGALSVAALRASKIGRESEFTVGTPTCKGAPDTPTIGAGVSVPFRDRACGVPRPPPELPVGKFREGTLTVPARLEDDAYVRTLWEFGWESEFTSGTVPKGRRVWIVFVRSWQLESSEQAL